jgi:hypothetical protein
MAVQRKVSFTPDISDAAIEAEAKKVVSQLQAQGVNANANAASGVFYENGVKKLIVSLGTDNPTAIAAVEKDNPAIVKFSGALPILLKGAIGQELAAANGIAVPGIGWPVGAVDIPTFQGWLNVFYRSTFATGNLGSLNPIGGYTRLATVGPTDAIQEMRLHMQLPVGSATSGNLTVPEDGVTLNMADPVQAIALDHGPITLYYGALNSRLECFVGSDGKLYPRSWADRGLFFFNNLDFESAVGIGAIGYNGAAGDGTDAWPTPAYVNPSP